MQRCGWVSTDPLYQEYHDNEWGIAVTDRDKLFEMLCLEGQQAGLSWITVLKKRQNYRHAFHQFQAEKVARMSEADLDNLMKNSGLIRHHSKLSSIINNANALITMEKRGEYFSHFVWSFVNHQQQVNHIVHYQQIPTKTMASHCLSLALKKQGFKFVGDVTCYSFMQACGLINDHEISCFCHPKNHD